MEQKDEGEKLGLGILELQKGGGCNSPIEDATRIILLLGWWLPEISNRTEEKHPIQYMA